MNLIYNDYESEFRKVIIENESIDNFNLLKELKKLGLTIGFITTCRKHYLNILIKELKLENLFDIIIAREDVKELKPSPLAYLKAIETLNLNKDYCLCIEDSKRGIDSAIACGIKTIQVNNFNEIKYIDERTINYESANIVLNNILKIKKGEV